MENEDLRDDRKNRISVPIRKCEVVSLQEVAVLWLAFCVPIKKTIDLGRKVTWEGELRIRRGECPTGGLAGS